MKSLLLFVIRIYWFLIPEYKRRNCIFRISCSQFVFQQIKTQGLRKGLKAFKFRFHNCRSGVEFFHNPITKEQNAFLPNGSIISQEEIAARLITNI